MITAQDLLLIERSIVLPAPRERVWLALTEKEQLSSWSKMSLQGELEPGARASIRITEPGYEKYTFPLLVQTKEPESSFSWRWVPGDAFVLTQDESQATEVTFTLEDVEEGTRLTVVESGFDRVDAKVRDQALATNTEGWTAQLENLAAYVRDAH